MGACSDDLADNTQNVFMCVCEKKEAKKNVLSDRKKVGRGINLQPGTQFYVVNLFENLFNALIFIPLHISYSVQWCRKMYTSISHTCGNNIANGNRIESFDDGAATGQKWVVGKRMIVSASGKTFSSIALLKANHGKSSASKKVLLRSRRIFGIENRKKRIQTHWKEKICAFTSLVYLLNRSLHAMQTTMIKDEKKVQKEIPRSQLTLDEEDENEIESRKKPSFSMNGARFTSNHHFTCTRKSFDLPLDFSHFFLHIQTVGQNVECVALCDNTTDPVFSTFNSSNNSQNIGRLTILLTFNSFNVQWQLLAHLIQFKWKSLQPRMRQQQERKKSTKNRFNSRIKGIELHAPSP